MTTEGTCDPAFTAVREVLAASLADGGDLGAAVTVVVGGRTVVDLWGGTADARTGRAWERDTRCVTFSATKAVTAAAALLLAEQGGPSLHAPVRSWWPEFRTPATTGVHLLTHQAGLPAFDRPVTVEEAADPAALAALLAAQTPEWEPGTAHGYHALTFGWLVGEYVRRVSGRPVGEFVRAAFDPALEIGTDDLEGLARIAAGRPARADDVPATPEQIRELVAATQDPSSPFLRSTTNPSASFNNPLLLRADWPAAGLVTTARALAAFYDRLPRTLASLSDAMHERVRGPDRTLVFESAFGLGFMRPSANMYLPPAARATAYGHPGASGALGIGDPEHGLAFGYIPNLSRPALGDRRAYRLVEAVYSAL